MEHVIVEPWPFPPPPTSHRVIVLLLMLAADWSVCVCMSVGGEEWSQCPCVEELCGAALRTDAGRSHETQTQQSESNAVLSDVITLAGCHRH